jgi:hypothetical protein
VLIVTLSVYKHNSWQDRGMAIAQCLTVAAILIGYISFATGNDAYKSIYMNLLFISDGNESMSMLWYFYTLTFQNYLNSYRFLILVYPYCLIIPTVLNTKLLEGSFNSYSEMPIDKQNSLNAELDKYAENMEEKPENYKKFLVKDQANFSIYTVRNYHMSMCFAQIFIIYMISKEYLVSYDFIIVMPFLLQHWRLVKHSPLATLLMFVMALSYGGQFVMFSAWQMRIIANVNNYWTQTFINSLVWAIIYNTMISKVKSNAQEYQVPVKFYYEEIKAE